MIDPLFAAVDHYCERIDASFWSEPINAITNLSFLIAAVLLYRQYKALKLKDQGALLLISLTALVGAGSLAFHTFGNTIAMFADILPIMCFVYSYLYVALRNLLGLSHKMIFFLLAAFTITSALLGSLPAPYNVNGSSSYFACLIALIFMGFSLSKTLPAISAKLYYAAMCFTISLAFRSTDMMLCDSIPLGTHFLWHIMNGLVLYILTRTIILHKSRAII